MTERDYINISEKKAVDYAYDILKDICVANSIIIKEDEYKIVMQQLFRWQEKYFKLANKEIL